MSHMLEQFLLILGGNRRKYPGHARMSRQNVRAKQVFTDLPKNVRDLDKGYKELVRELSKR